MALGELLESLRTVSKSIGGWRHHTGWSVIALTYIIRFRREIVASHGDVVHSCWVQTLRSARWQWQKRAFIFHAMQNISPCPLNSMQIGRISFSFHWVDKWHVGHERNELRCHWPVDLWYSTLDYDCVWSSRVSHALMSVRSTPYSLTARTMPCSHVCVVFWPLLQHCYFLERRTANRFGYIRCRNI